MKTKYKFLTTESQSHREHREEPKRLKEKIFFFPLRTLRPLRFNILRFINVLCFLCASVALWYSLFCIFCGLVSAELTDYAGVIHVHTTYSDGRGTVEEVARIANRQNLDFIIITDHNTLKPLRDGKEGQYKNTLVLLGDEVSTEAGHYIALNVNKEIDTHMPLQNIINEVKGQGGLGFVAHPYRAGKKEWVRWDVENFTGLEAYNMSEDMLDENKLCLFFKTILLSQRIVLLSSLNRPDKAFSKWDSLTISKKIVAIAGNDAHGKHLFFIRFDPYDVMFAFGRTHILSSEKLSKESIYDALQAGHCYGSIDALGNPKGFSFVLKKNSAVVGIMGDEMEFSPSLKIEVALPVKAKINLLKDGSIIKETMSKSFGMDVSEKGVYRVEVFRKNKLWLFSNPIYIR